MASEFLKAVAAWDGKSAKDLDSIYQSFCTAEGFDEMIFRWSEIEEQ